VFGERVPLKAYVDARLADHDVALKAALASNERRLDGMNEFRQQLKDQTGLFSTRAETDAKIAGLTLAVESNRNALGDRMTRSEVYALVGTAGVICGLVGGLVGHFFGR